MRIIVVLAVCIAAVSAGFPKYGMEYVPERIVGGSSVTITTYPSIATVLFAFSGVTFTHFCGSAIINNRSFLTAAHCTIGFSPSNFRMRVGSANAHSGGVLHNAASIINHPSYNPITYNSDIAIIRAATTLVFSTSVRAASIPSMNYILGDNQVVFAAGWGATAVGGANVEALRHVQIWTINQNTCAERYATAGVNINTYMLCSGWLDTAGRGQCQGDSGGPLYHNNITVNTVVGISSFSHGCGLAAFPSVNTRVSRFVPWIQYNA